jgi:hypothetical protein
MDGNEGDACTTPNGRSGYLVATGRDGELTCVEGESVSAARSTAAAAAEQVRTPESQEGIDANYPGGQKASNA